MRVLHVEDNPVDADLSRRQVARTDPGIALENAPTLQAARERLAAPERYDVVLIDLGLPDGSGLDLLTEIRDRQLPVAVVMLTGAGDQDLAIAAMQAGADDYLSKAEILQERLPATLRAASKRHQEAAAQRERPLRVLYAEHSEADIDLTRRHFARQAPHIRLTARTNVAQVLAELPVAPGQPAAYDVLLLDYRLPGTNALEAVKILRDERGLDLPIVLVTGQGTEAIAAQAIRLGVDDYLTKHPGYLNELPATLEKVHHQAQLALERRNLKAATERLEHVVAASPVILYTLRLAEGGAQRTWVSGNVARLLGLDEAQACQSGLWLERVHPADRAAAAVDIEALGRGEEQIREYRFLDKQDRLHWLRDELRPIPDGADGVREAIGVWRDITSEKLAEQLRETRVAVLDAVVANAPLAAILETVATRLEALHEHTRVSILLRKGSDGRLYTGAAPSLPAFFNAAVDGLPMVVGSGSCGSAAALNETVIVEDIRTHPYWAAYREVAERAGVRACWSIPFQDESGRVLGTFGVYYAQPRTPSRNELGEIAEFARITGLVVERVEALSNLRQAAAVFESTSEGVVITDLQPRILQVNPAYCAITGFAPEEAVGRNPNLIGSGRQDADFHRTLWRSVIETGNWRGEIWNRRKNGEVVPQLLTISTVRDGAGRPTHYVGVMTDISQIKQSEERLEHLAHFDPLTDLPNRLLLHYRLEHALEIAARSQRTVAVLFIDLDNFKNINDSLGHPVGDDILRAIATRLAGRLREGDTLGRLGGDEFLLILEDVPSPRDAGEVAHTLLHLLRDPFTVAKNAEVYVTASIGVSLYPADATNVTEMIQHADAAMYKAKDQGRNTFKYYTSELTTTVNARLDLDSRMRRALGQGEFVLHYQPVIDMATGELDACEALVRWNNPERGLISPAKFIPIAEETGMIVPLGEWVLRTACGQTVAWMQAGLPPIVMSVNVSGRQLQQGHFAVLVAEILAETGLPPNQLKLELTESTIMGRGEDAVDLLNDLRALGIGLAIDDFGTGFSSLARLKRFPIDELKIDQTFVQDIPDDPSGMEIAATIIAMARNLKLRVVAEGVETEEQLAFLRKQGCHAYQGYLYSRPVAAPEFAVLAERSGERTGPALR